MKHIKADFSKLEVVECKYHRTYMTFPDATLEVSIDGVKQQYRIRKRAAKRDSLYHSNGLNCALIVYDGIVLAYEIIKSDVMATRINIDSVIANYSDEDWYFDNERFYQLNVRPSQNFLSVQHVNVLDPIHMTYSTSIDVVVNDCFVVSQNGQILLQTPPISTTLENKVKKFLLLDNEQDLMYVSLSTLLKICNAVTRLYGGDAIEEFDIPQYMIRHKTVNLAKLPPYVRDNSTTNLKPFEAIGYLLGLIYKEDNIASNILLLKVLRNMCNIGIVNITSTLEENVYKDKKIEIRKIDLNSILETDIDADFIDEDDLDLEIELNRL